MSLRVLNSARFFSFGCLFERESTRPFQEFKFCFLCLFLVFVVLSQMLKFHQNSMILPKGSIYSI